MKKSFLLALCSLAIIFVACKKPVEPTPEPVDYSSDYVGNYTGQYMFAINSMNHQQTEITFPIEGIIMDIAKGSEANTITATVTVDNKSYQATGTTTSEKAVITLNGLVIDEMHQISFPYLFDIDLLLEGTKTDNDTLNIVGSFTGDGKFTFNGAEVPVEEVSGTVTGKLVKQ